MKIFVLFRENFDEDFRTKNTSVVSRKSERKEIWFCRIKLMSVEVNNRIRKTSKSLDDRNKTRTEVDQKNVVQTNFVFNKEQEEKARRTWSQNY